ncbi:zinc-binding dehydrogenase [Herbiconiux daphne]|uniref:Zinc-binding dehydrogenase n=1 Tax=Herbiconiux daphne TaxID=2970914 RepID=A0ABT2H3Q3_9MICO|nr:zinc-binding dehydrogenase [Herbiconiux daphne]MCS5734532.1 zinc-binding dehydrogenase [Herbiconiux daphne]
MWAHTLVAPGRFESTEASTYTEADVREGEVLLRALVGGVCGSDLPTFRGRAHHHPDDAGGWASNVAGVPLHEIVGEVVFSRDSALSVGDRVVGWASRFDGISELVISHGSGLAPYDPSLTPAEAITIQPLACVLGAVERLDLHPGVAVTVLGQGPIGLLFSHVLNQAGAVVTGVDRIDRSEAAETFGVTNTVTTTADRWAGAVTDAERPEIVVEAVGHQIGTLEDSLAAVAFGGQVYYFGVPDDPIYPISMRAMFRKNLVLLSGATLDRRRLLLVANDYLLAHDALRREYVSHVFPVDRVQEAFEAAIEPRPGQYKIALDMVG